MSITIMSTTPQSAQTTQPEKPIAWYKQFWPWFIIFFPASAVVAGLITVGIAFKYSDSLVKDNWYKDGKAINQRLDKQKRAKALGINALITLDRDKKHLALTLDNVDGLQSNSVNVSLFHPTQPEKDREYQAYYTPQGQFVIQLQVIPSGFYHIAINPKNTEWKLTGTLDFSDDVVNTYIQPR